jgi:type I restriction enzyme S subunit
MINDWKQYKLEEVCRRITSGGTPLTSKKEYYENGTIPWLKTTEVHKEIIRETDTFITEEGLKNSSAKLIEENSIVVAMYGDGGTAGKIALTKIPISTNQACCNLTVDESKAYYSFIYYYLKMNYDNLVNLKSGGSQQNLNALTIRKFPILLPPLPTQKRIASILSAYDDLIEVNNQRIKLLEETARELYKEWFVRMRFPEYQKSKFKKGIPTDWRIEPIGKVIDYHIGGGWGNDNKDNRFSVAGYVIRGTDIPKVRAGQANQDVYRFHKASNMKSRELIEGDIVFESAGGSEGQPLGRTCYITQAMMDAYGDKVMAASFCKQIRTTSIPSLYLYYFLNYLYDTGMIEAYQVQSTGISNYQFEPFLKFQQIILPKDDLMQSFHDKAILMQKQITVLGQQNNQLRQIRDRLLPRLISGKLEVKNK